MATHPGESIGHYSILDEIGRGGMGVVFLGRDTRLERDVAIKALPEHLASDPDRLARFEREAKTLAQLNHPNVAGIYGIEEHDGARYLVLEYVEGETLADKLDRGSLEPDEAVEIAGQIALGVAAAHDAGVIHRDLKPANIRLTPEGAVKVLDFGLARHEEGASSSSVGSQLKTLTSPVMHSPTTPGVILGTAAYMSPEQARGRRVDKRTDIWSFGVVLYEMLAGASPFVGETATDSIGAILHKDPDLGRLPGATPVGVRRVLARCLDRDKDRRYRDLGDVRIELDSAMHEPTIGESDAQKRSAGLAVALALAVLALGLGSAAAWFLKPEPMSQEMRLSITAPFRHYMASRPSISRDGSYVVFAARPEDGGSTLGYLRHIDEHHAAPMEETRGGRGWRFSPSGEQVALITPVAEGGSQQQLMRWSMDPGLPPVPIAVLPESVAISGYNYQWLNEDTFIFSDSRTNKLRFVDSESGTVSDAEEIDLGNYPGSYDQLLNRVDDTRVLCRLFQYTGLGYQEDVGLLDTEQMRVEVIVENSAEAKIGPDGSILFTRGGTLYGATFDPDSLQVGSAVQLVAGLRTTNAYIDAQFDIADDGTLVFGSGGEQGLDRHIEIRSPDDSTELLGIEARAFTEAVTVSRDESRVLAVVTNPNKMYEIWGTEVANPRMRKVRALATSDLNYPVFASDHDTFVYMRATDSRTGVEVASFDGNFEPYWLVEPVEEGFLAPVSVNPVTNRVLLMWEEPEGFRLYEANLEADAELTPVFTSNSNVFFGDYSPDGSMLAYASDETGRREVYVRSINEDGSLGRASAVTTRGGFGALWFPGPSLVDAQEGSSTYDLLVPTPEGNMVFPITSGDRPAVGEGMALPYEVGAASFRGALSGRRLVTFVRGQSEGLSRHHEVILNWYDKASKLIHEN